MKKSAAFVVLLLCGLQANAQGLPSLWGQPAPIDFGDKISDQQMIVLLDILERKSWGTEAAKLKGVAADLTTTAKFALYERYRIQGFWGFLNVYGVGSLFQGDAPTSLVTVGGILVGAGTNVYAENGSMNENLRPSLRISGTVIMVGAIAYGLIRPWFYADEQNRGLRAALFSEKTVF